MIKTMFRLFSSVLCENDENKTVNLDRDTWVKLFNLSKKHDLAHLIGYALKNFENKPDEDIQKAFEREMNTALFRYVKISYDLEAISNALEKAQISFIPLKGSAIRKYYPEPWLRTSGDIDILIADSDVEKTKKLLSEELSYTYVSEWDYEVSFHTPAKTHIELHHTLKDENEAINKVLSGVWERSAPVAQASFCYEMSDEMFYFYHIAHMAKHFVNGGCGIRPFIDIWVLNNNCEFDKQKRYALLDEAGLLPFAKAAEKLSEVWLGNEPHTSLSEQLEQFILSGGTYGTVANRVAVQRTVAGGKFSYIMTRIFLPYDQLKLTYPNLVKRKWLFPFYQIKRWFRIFRKGKLKKSMQEVEITSAVTTDKNARTTWLLKELGIKR